MIIQLYIYKSYNKSSKLLHIINRIKKIGKEANIHINYSSLVMKVIDQLYDTFEVGKNKLRDEVR